ncbi:hypothetical protein BJV74DRAFT_93924 [Russula compacta]|nr:hypothetical protein BJV74DRAFT_93924 [Russula compacta]
MNAPLDPNQLFLRNRTHRLLLDTWSLQELVINSSRIRSREPLRSASHCHGFVIDILSRVLAAGVLFVDAPTSMTPMVMGIVALPFLRMRGSWLYRVSVPPSSRMPSASRRRLPRATYSIVSMLGMGVSTTLGVGTQSPGSPHPAGNLQVVSVSEGYHITPIRRTQIRGELIQ